MHLKSWLLISLAAAASSAHAQIERQHAAHAHGSAELRLALDASSLEIELQAPGMDVVGFEHSPADAAQRAAITDAIAFLDSAAWIELPAGAGCTLKEAAFHTHGYDRGGPEDALETGTEAANAHAHADHDGHAHPGDHAHASTIDAHDDHGHHAEFHGKLRWHCSRPAALARIDITLGTRFSSIARLTVESVSDHGQGRTLLPGAKGRVDLPR